MLAATIMYLRENFMMPGQNTCIVYMKIFGSKQFLNDERRNGNYMNEATIVLVIMDGFFSIICIWMHNIHMPGKNIMKIFFGCNAYRKYHQQTNCPKFFYSPDFFQNK